jgi:hypothetical protein
VLAGELVANARVLEAQSGRRRARAHARVVAVVQERRRLQRVSAMTGRIVTREGDPDHVTLVFEREYPHAIEHVWDEWTAHAPTAGQ